jgi:hypothetical protein
MKRGGPGRGWGFSFKFHVPSFKFQVSPILPIYRDHRGRLVSPIRFTHRGRLVSPIRFTHRGRLVSELIPKLK